MSEEAILIHLMGYWLWLQDEYVCWDRIVLFFEPQQKKENNPRTALLSHLWSLFKTMTQVLLGQFVGEDYTVAFTSI